MVKEIEISLDTYNLLEQARLLGEDLNDTLLRLIRRYEQTHFIKRQKQIIEDDDFQPLDKLKE